MRSSCAKLIGPILGLGVIGTLLSACVPGSYSTSPSTMATVAGNGPPIVPNGPTATAEVKGIAMSLRLTPAGPYFLSELIAVDVSLTNHTHTSVHLDGPSQAGPCGSALGVEMTGGGPPHYELPNATTHSCPWMGGTTVKPGQTLTIRQLLPLTESGNITLTGATKFLTATIEQGQRVITATPGPLDGHWPTIRLTVDPHIPANRALSLHRESSLVYVTAPLAAHGHLLYLFNLTCSDQNGPGSTWTGNFVWEPLLGGVVHQPGCPGVRPRWTISVSAVGYAIASGSYQ